MNKQVGNKGSWPKLRPRSWVREGAVDCYILVFYLSFCHRMSFSVCTELLKGVFQAQCHLEPEFDFKNCPATHKLLGNVSKSKFLSLERKNVNFRHPLSRNSFSYFQLFFLAKVFTSSLSLVCKVSFSFVNFSTSVAFWPDTSHNAIVASFSLMAARIASCLKYQDFRIQNRC